MSALSVEMADADDSGSWLESALRHAELAAHQIARLRSPWWNPAWRDLVAGDPRPARGFAARWGSRGKRSRPSAAGAAKADAAAARSPATPFDFGSGSGSGASTSGGDEGSSSPEKRRRVRDGGAADVSGAAGGCETKVVGIDRAPLGFSVSAAKDIRRTGKKKTLCELQEEERLLLQEKNTLQKEMELRKKVYDSLISENLRLKGQHASLQIGKVPVKSTTACASSSSPSSSACFVLPDLNEPLSENLD